MEVDQGFYIQIPSKLQKKSIYQWNFKNILLFHLSIYYLFNKGIVFVLKNVMFIN